MRMEMVPRGLFSSFLPERCFLISTISVVDWDGDAKALVSSTTKEVYGYRSTIKTLSIVSLPCIFEVSLSGKGGGSLSSVCVLSSSLSVRSVVASDSNGSCSSMPQHFSFASCNLRLKN